MEDTNMETTQLKADQVMAGEQLAAAITAAQQKTTACEARVKNGQARVEKVQDELKGKITLRAGVVTEYDKCAQEDDVAGASDCRAELDLLDTQIRGAELRLQAAQNEVQKLNGELTEARGAVSELLRQQQVETETAETSALIADAERVYLDWTEAGEKFAGLIQQMRPGFRRTFLDPANERRVQASFEQLWSRARGFAWYPPPERPKN
jgi:hypothetical protein